jgi:hypothetical protein
MRVAARQEFESRYTGSMNFKLLEKIYTELISPSTAPQLAAKLP